MQKNISISMLGEKLNKNQTWSCYPEIAGEEGVEYDCTLSKTHYRRLSISDNLWLLSESVQIIIAWCWILIECKHVIGVLVITHCFTKQLSIWLWMKMVGLLKENGVLNKHSITCEIVSKLNSIRSYTGVFWIISCLMYKLLNKSVC